MTSNQLNKSIASQMKLGQEYLDRINGSVEREMTKHLKASLANTQNILAKMYAEKGASVTFPEMNKFNRLTKMESEILTELKTLGYNAGKLTENAIKINFSESYYNAGFVYESSLRSGLTFTQLPIDAIRAAVINPYDRIGWNARSKKAIILLNQHIQETVATGLIQGYGYKKTAKMFADKFDGYTNNLKRIIATETHRASTMGHNIAYDRAKKGADDLGIKMNHIWDATLDGKTRVDHAAIDGIAANKNNEWRFPSGQITKGPGLSGSPEQDINCRCSARGEIDEKTPGTRIDNITKKSIKYQNYSEWAKGKKVPYNKYRNKFNGNFKSDDE